MYFPLCFSHKTWGYAHAHEFIGDVGNIMTETGLTDIISYAFLLKGKTFHICMRALKMVVEVIIIPTIDDVEVKCNDMIMDNLEASARKSEIYKLWLDCLIKTVL